MKSSFIKIAVLVLMSFFLIQCSVSKENLVSVKLIDLSKISKNDGNSQKVRLEYVEKKTWAYLEVIERSPNVKSVTRVTNNDRDEIYIGQIHMSPVEDVITYNITELLEEIFKVRGKDSKLLSANYTSNIWKQKVGTYAKTRLTYGKQVDIHPSFTADGKKIVFSSSRNGLNRILWMLNVDGGGGLRRVTSTAAEDFLPSASPTEQGLIAYSSIPQGASEAQVWTVEADVNLSTQLREGSNPRISPDGKNLLFLRKENEEYCDKKNKTAGKDIYQIWMMSIEGDSETQLTINDNFCVRNPMWSPDGKWIVFASNENMDSNNMRNFDLWLMAVNGTKRLQLTTNGSMDIYPAFDREGKHIYFVSNRGGKWNIWRLKPVLD